MNPSYAAYAGLSAGAFLSMYPFYWLKTRGSKQARLVFSQRMGRYSDAQIAGISGSPRIWLHAVSVGEVRAAQAVITALVRRLPQAAIVLSTTTLHGQRAAREAMGSRATCLFAPLDFTVSVHRALTALRPQVMVCLETEIWPNWLMTANRLDIPTAIINGRISGRSIRSYRKVRPLMRCVLESVSAFSMIHDVDAGRVKELGAPADKIFVNGNAKSDLLLEQMVRADLKGLKKRYGVEEGRIVIVAGSTRGGEPRIILNSYHQVLARFPDALLIIVPRHVENALKIKKIVFTEGLTCRLRSELENPGESRDASVVVVDVIGELQALYGIATVVFCGGSIAPLGGQNILEAAAWGKPVFYGPYMEDFPDAKELLEKNSAAVEVADEKELTEKMLYYLSNPGAAEALGHRARQASLSCGGAAERHAEVIMSLL
jgi:3-deoxy-D-manno-octulosonic-acid transferase